MSRTSGVKEGVGAYLLTLLPNHIYTTTFSFDGQCTVYTYIAVAHPSIG
jgi:hypothetical protein